MNNTKEKNKYKNTNLPHIISLLKSEFNELGIKRGEEIKAIDSIQFVLNYKGRYMQCYINRYDPYMVGYRIVGDKLYKKCLPWKFVDESKVLLIH